MHDSSVSSETQMTRLGKLPWSSYAMRITFLAILYFAFALISRLLTTTPDYTAPLWPAAGLAFAALLVWGIRVWPGVWLGAFIAALWLDSSLPGIAIAALIATGATLQALLSVRLTRNLFAASAPLARDRDAWRFLLLGGPAACLLAASLGTLTLYGFDRISQTHLITTWLTWWAGDSLGVLLFTPLALLIIPGRGPSQFGIQVALPLLITSVLLAGGLVTLNAIQDSRAHQLAEEHMDEVYDAGFLPLHYQLQSLRYAERFFAASEHVSREEFGFFSRSIIDQSGMLALDWAPRIRADEIEQFVASVRREGLTDYRILELDPLGAPSPISPRTDYYPVLFSEPAAKNAAALGLDHGFETPRRAAMHQARDRAEAVMARLVPLLRTGRESLLVYQPVYHRGFDPAKATVDARREALHGFIVGVFDIESLITPLKRAAQARSLAFRIIDTTPGESEIILFDTLGESAVPWWHRKIELVGRSWRLEMLPLITSPPLGASLESRFYFGFSLLLALLAAFASLTAAGRMTATEAQVAERTADLKRELSARRTAESALRESEESLAITLRSIGDAVLATDINGRVIRMNPVAEELTGWSLAQALDRPIDEIFVIINEQTRQPAIIPVEEVLRTGEVHGLANHTVLIARDGTEHAIADSAAPIRDNENRLRGVVLVFRDVGQERAAELALQASEARFRRLVQLSPFGIFVQCEGRFAFLNPKAISLLGGQSEVELLGRPVLDFLHPDSREIVQERIRRLNEEQTPAPALEEKWQRLDGAVFDGEATAVPYEHEGRPGALVLLQDISERSQAESKIQQLIAELTEAQAAAEQASQAKSAFLATMSHEIRTPMNGVVGMIEVLTRTRLSEHQAELVSTIRESAATLLTIIDDILDFSKIEAGRLEIERTPVAIAELVEGLCTSLIQVADRHGVELFLFVSPAIPARVLSDEVRLRQILYNLVGNAIKFSSSLADRRGRVMIRAEVAQAEPLHVAFDVIDNGIGMSPETRNVLFSAFTQAEVSTTRRFGGTGLGLAICKRLVDMLSGEIAVESELNAGSTFTVTLPFELASEQPAPSHPDLAGIECILVNGGELAAEDLRVYLEHAGARVRLATDATAAIQTASGLAGPVVVIQDHGQTRQVPSENFNTDTNIRHLMITRGKRRRARLEASGVVTLDGNALRRKALLRAVAVTAGLASPEVFHDTHNAETIGEEIIVPTVDEASAQGRLILVAEDDDINQKVIKQQLALLGYAAEIAANGKEALRMWRTGRYALLLTDLHMPQMDGYTLAQMIREEEHGHGRIPILALTANALRGEANRARAVGMDEYLTKPIQLHQLRMALEKWLPQTFDTAIQDMPTDLSHSKTVVDITVLEKLIGTDPASIHKLLAQYQEASTDMAGQLHAAFTVDDMEQVGEIAHKLKSASRSVGALPLGDLCAALEHAGKDCDRQRITDLLPQVEHAMAEVDTCIATRLSEKSSRNGE